MRINRALLRKLLVRQMSQEGRGVGFHIIIKFRLLLLIAIYVEKRGIR